MNVFVYDRTFDGLLTVVFEAFRLKVFPEALLAETDPRPLLAERVVTVASDPEKAARVWRGLERKLSPLALRQVMYAWLTEEPAAAELVVRYLRAVFSGVAETNFGHPDVLALRQTAHRVAHERERIRQFVRFQKTADGLYFAALAPRYDLLPLSLDHFLDRFGDQKWALYDLKRAYGFYYDLETVREIGELPSVDPGSGRLPAENLDPEEMLFQEAWRAYFKAATIGERANPRLQRQFLPRRYWPFLTEMRAAPGLPSEPG